MRVARIEWAGKKLDAFCRALHEVCRSEVRLVRSGIAVGTFVVEPGCEATFVELAAAHGIRVTFFDADASGDRVKRQRRPDA